MQLLGSYFLPENEGTLRVLCDDLVNWRVLDLFPAKGSRNFRLYHGDYCGMIFSLVQVSPRKVVLYCQNCGCRVEVKKCSLEGSSQKLLGLVSNFSLMEGATLSEGSSGSG